MKVSQIIDKIEVLDHNIVSDEKVMGAFLDSRLVRKNTLFFAVKGESVDGNDYAETAMKQGAAAVIMDNAEKYKSITGNKILVADSIEAMKKLGAIRFQETEKKKIAVTGSFGKTGMKEMLKCIFGEAGIVYATDGNKNNDLGVALTGAGIDDDAEILVIELGSNNMGEIPALSEIVKPDMAIVTTVGHAHIGRFKSIENIIFEKLSITKGLKKDGILIIPQKLKPFVPEGDYKFYTFGSADTATIYMTSVEHKGSYILFKTNIDDTVYRFNHPYIHVAENSLGAILAGHLIGLSGSQIAEGVAKYTTSKGHGDILECGNVLIIDDTYNAGFESIIKSAESLSKIEDKKKYAVYGEMGEIEGYERELYNDICHLAYDYPEVTFLLCGASYTDAENLENRKIFNTKDELIEEVKKISEGIVLVKASRARKFEEVVKALKDSLS